MSSDKVHVIELNPTGTYEIISGKLFDKDVRWSEGCVTASRDTVFFEHPPQWIEQIKDLRPDKLIQQKILTGSPKRITVVGFKDFTPIRYEKDDDNERLKKEGRSFWQVSLMNAKQEEALKARHQERLAMGFSIAAIGTAVLAVTLSVAVGMQMLFGG